MSVKETIFDGRSFGDTAENLTSQFSMKSARLPTYMYAQKPLWYSTNNTPIVLSSSHSDQIQVGTTLNHCSRDLYSKLDYMWFGKYIIIGLLFRCSLIGTTF